VSTDKVDTEIPAPVSGTLLSISVNEDETVEVGAELAVIGSGSAGGGEQAQAPAAPAQTETPAQPEPEQQEPEAQPQDATHSLHVAISSLRRYLDPHVGSYLLLDAGRYYINDNVPIEDDCTTFLRLSDAGQQRWRAGDLQGAQQSYSIALKSYQGDYYLDDHDLLWEVAEQERLLSRYLTALDYLGRILVAQGRFEAAIECYQQLLQRDNYREDVHCHVMSCYQQLGRRNEALRQYHVCASMLADDFGLHPMPETRALYDEIIGDIAQR